MSFYSLPYVFYIGKDGTEAFEDVGHSPDARELREQYLIGEVTVPAARRVQVSLRSFFDELQVDVYYTWDDISLAQWSGHLWLITGGPGQHRCVSGVKDLWCSSTVRLLSAQI